jgi:hypothetical protein
MRQRPCSKRAMVRDSEKRGTTRRDFLRAGVGLLAVGSGLGAFADKSATGPQPESEKSLQGVKDGRARVVIARSDAVRGAEGRFNKDVLKHLVEKSVMRVTDTSDPRKAWQQLFSPRDTIGLKVSCLPGPGLSTHTELADVITRQLIDAGIPENQIIVWERTDRELVRTGFEINRSGKGVRCFGTERDYEDTITMMESVGSCFSMIQSRLCTAMISVPVLKDHDLSGVSIGMKNFYGAIHNPNKYHDNSCDPYIADLNAYPTIRDKLRLTICDALYAQYHGGPAFTPAYRWEYNGVLASTDPVALDRVGCDIIEEKRKTNGMKSLEAEGRAPKWLETAAARGLGEARSEKIEVIYV